MSTPTKASFVEHHHARLWLQALHFGLVTPPSDEENDSQNHRVMCELSIALQCDFGRLSRVALAAVEYYWDKSSGKWCIIAFVPMDQNGDYVAETSSLSLQGSTWMYTVPDISKVPVNRYLIASATQRASPATGHQIPVGVRALSDASLDQYLKQVYEHARTADRLRTQARQSLQLMRQQQHRLQQQYLQQYRQHMSRCQQFDAATTRLPLRLARPLRPSSPSSTVDRSDTMMLDTANDDDQLSRGMSAAELRRTNMPLTLSTSQGVRTRQRLENLRLSSASPSMGRFPLTDIADRAHAFAKPGIDAQRVREVSSARNLQRKEQRTQLVQSHSTNDLPLRRKATPEGEWRPLLAGRS
ncbi:MAG: hypothetical protein M1825_002838 [Sarcosagium campestre]|nr:MAG: hypothetical protein M1825_002838 [Sarcosagium campestre]